MTGTRVSSDDLEWLLVVVNGALAECTDSDAARAGRLMEWIEDRVRGRERRSYSNRMRKARQHEGR